MPLAAEDDLRGVEGRLRRRPQTGAAVLADADDRQPRRRPCGGTRQDGVGGGQGGHARSHPRRHVGGREPRRAARARAGDRGGAVARRPHAAARSTAPVPTRIGGFGGADGLRAISRTSMSTPSSTRRIHSPMRSRATRPRPAASPGLRCSRSAGHPGARAPATAGPMSLDAGRRGGARRQPRRVFLTVGRLELAAFAAAPQHHYLVRTIEPIGDALPVPSRDHAPRPRPVRRRGRARADAHAAIDVLVTKNSGGAATYGKIAAARALGLPVVLVARPEKPAVEAVDDADAAFAWLSLMPGLRTSAACRRRAARPAPRHEPRRRGAEDHEGRHVGRAVFRLAERVAVDRLVRAADGAREDHRRLRCAPPGRKPQRVAELPGPRLAKSGCRARSRSPPRRRRRAARSMTSQGLRLSESEMAQKSAAERRAEPRRGGEHGRDARHRRRRRARARPDRRPRSPRTPPRPWRRRRDRRPRRPRRARPSAASSSASARALAARPGCRRRGVSGLRAPERGRDRARSRRGRSRSASALRRFRREPVGRRRVRGRRRSARRPSQAPPETGHEDHREIGRLVVASSRRAGRCARSAMVPRST